MSDRTVAIAFLTELKAPITEPMIAAVTIWRKAEGPLTGQNGTNNPFNIEHKGNPGILWYSFQKGWQAGSDNGSTVFFATFATPEDGARAAALNLQRVKGQGYENVIAQARAGDPRLFLKGLGNSGWAAGRYRGPNGVNGEKLTNAWKLIAGQFRPPTTPPAAGPPSTPGTPPVTDPKQTGSPVSKIVWPWAPGGAASNEGWLKITEGKLLTQTDIDYIVAQYERGGAFKDPVSGAAAKYRLEEALKLYLGYPWIEATRISMQAQIGAEAKAADPVGTAAENAGLAITGLGGTLVSMATYLAALVVIGLGIFLYSKGGGETSVPAAGY